jgi:hypothetical protein
MAPLTDSRFCWAHDVSRGSDRARARRAGGRSRAVPTLHPAGAEPPSLRTVAEITAMLERVVHDTEAQANTAARSRTLGGLLTLAAKLVEVGELESRLEALEQRLAPRRA